MQNSPLSLKEYSVRLVSRRAYAFGLCKWCMIVSVVGAGGYLSTHNGSDAWAIAAAILFLGFGISPLFYGLFCWLNEFVFVRRVFAETLGFLDLRSGQFQSESPSLRQGAYRSYGTYKALVILFKERPIVSWGLVLACLFGIQFVVPALVLAYAVWIRFLCMEKHARIERDLLAAFQSAKSVQAILHVESTASFNSMLDALLEFSGDRAA
jgi:hypothetical protein